eukprot:7268838-Alexandrium_andersonii.AAC.1
MVQEEGGGKEDEVAAKRIAIKCAAMGYPWISWNEFSERYDFLYLRKGFQEDLGRAWTMFKTYTD